MLSRRDFLTAGAGALMVLGVPVTVLANQLSKAPVELGIDPKLEGKFDVFWKGQLVAQLDLVGLSSPAKPDPRIDQFILNFKSTKSAILPEASYQLFHPMLGELSVFLQPCGTLNCENHDGQQYHACMAMLK